MLLSFFESLYLYDISIALQNLDIFLVPWDTTDATIHRKKISSIKVSLLGLEEVHIALDWLRSVLFRIFGEYSVWGLIVAL